MISQGKTLLELCSTVNISRLSLATLTDDHACITWQEDGTLAYFSYDDGFPAVYYAAYHEPPYNKPEQYMRLESLVTILATVDDEYLTFLLTAPVWVVIEHVSREWINTLLADIDINL